jgi:hypothetical protein
VAGRGDQVRRGRQQPADRPRVVRRGVRGHSASYNTGVNERATGVIVRRSVWGL